MSDDGPDSVQSTLTGEVRATVVNQKHTDAYDVDIGRAGDHGERDMTNTPVGKPGWLGNPYRMSDGHSRSEAVTLFREKFAERLDDPVFREAVDALDGATLACHCVEHAVTSPSRPFEVCHGEAIAEYLNTGEGPAPDDH